MLHDQLPDWHTLKTTVLMSKLRRDGYGKDSWLCLARVALKHANEAVDLASRSSIDELIRSLYVRIRVLEYLDDPVAALADCTQAVQLLSARCRLGFKSFGTDSDKISRLMEGVAHVLTHHDPKRLDLAVHGPPGSDARVLLCTRQPTFKEDVLPPNVTGASSVAYRGKSIRFGGKAFKGHVLNGEPSNDVWCFNPNAKAGGWTRIRCSSSGQPAPRSYATACVYDGKMWVYGCAWASHTHTVCTE